MAYTKLNTGATMPVIGFGTAILPIPNAEPEKNHKWGTEVIESALEVGYRYLDTASLYLTEQIVGSAVKNKSDQGLLKREDVFITTKVWWNSMRQEDVVPSLKESLKNLQMDYVDLFLIHWPISMTPSKEKWPSDIKYGNIDHLETWKGMEECHKLGLAKAIGVSNFNSKQIQRILDNCTVKPANCQIESHPFLANQKLVDFCQKNGIVVTAFSPLSGLPKQFHPNPERPSIFTDPVIKQISERIKKSPAQVTLRYHIQRGVVPIPKSTNQGRIKENFQVFDFELSSDDMALMTSCDKGYRLCSLFEDHPQYPFNEEY